MGKSTRLQQAFDNNMGSGRSYKQSRIAYRGNTIMETAFNFSLI
jgi:hypothetical protein